MSLYRLRRYGFVTIIVLSLGLIAATALGRFSIYVPKGSDQSHSDTTLATTIQSTAEIAGIGIALIFITAQLSSTGGRPLLVRQLYRSSELYVLAAYLTASLLGGYWALAAAPPAEQTQLGQRATDIVLILSSTTVLLVIPTLLLQIENLDPVTLASKLGDQLRADALIDYGLTEVNAVPEIPGTVRYRLSMVGLTPRSVDPLRPFHELLMEAVRDRDRVLFGKLYRHLLKPIARVHGAAWKSAIAGSHTGVSASGWVMRLLGRRYSTVERVHVTLALLHYSVKRARNMRTEWEGRDIGRHGIVTGIGHLIAALVGVRGSEQSIRVCLYATMHISGHYADITPFGRIEPLNVFFEAANALAANGKDVEARLCASVLGWISGNTQQITGARSGVFSDAMKPPLLREFGLSRAKSIAEPNWLPGVAIEDPWRNTAFAGGPIRQKAKSERDEVPRGGSLQDVVECVCTIWTVFRKLLP